MLLDHVVKILVGSYRDEAIEVFVGELVLESEGSVVVESAGEVGGEGGE